MEFNFMHWWKRYGEPFTAISIILFIAFSTVMIIKDRNLKQEINENCGWGEEDYFCFCEKSEAMEVKNKFEKVELNFSRLGIDNVSVAG